MMILAKETKIFFIYVKAKFMNVRNVATTTD